MSYFQIGQTVDVCLELDEPPYNFPYREVFNWTHRSLAYPMHVYVWHSSSPMCRLGRYSFRHTFPHHLRLVSMRIVMHLWKRRGEGHLSGMRGARKCRPATLLAMCKHSTSECIRVLNDHACSAKFNDSISPCPPH
jgi:hypothetical protein